MNFQLYFKDAIGKFRVKFLNFDNKSSEEHCLKCVSILRNYFKINQHEGNVESQSTTMSIDTTFMSSMNLNDSEGASKDTVLASNVFQVIKKINLNFTD